MPQGVLREDEDAFGRQLLDALSGASRSAMLERDDGERGTSMSPDVFFAEHAAWAAAERAVFEYVRGRVLDVGCGAGRHSLEAARRGMDAVAFDISPGAVEVSRARGVRDVRLMSLDDVNGRLGQFDTVLMLCGNFGLPGTREGMIRWLQRLRDLTTKDARVVLDTVDPYVDDPTDPKWHAYLERNRARRRMAGQVTIRLRYGDRLTPWFDLLLVSVEELTELAMETGWRVAVLDASESPDLYAVLGKTA
jgi:SAM-dependent methyltransferase